MRKSPAKRSRKGMGFEAAVESAREGGARKRRKPSVVSGARTTGLDQGFAEAAAAGGGIQPGAHPEFDQPTPLEKLGKGLKNLFDRFHK